MRYFVLLTRPEPALAFGVIVSALAGCTIALTGSTAWRSAGKISATIGAVDLPPITVTADDHLAMAAGAEEESGTGVHAHTGPMRSGVWPVRVRLWTGCAKARFGAWRQGRLSHLCWRCACSPRHHHPYRYSA